MSGKISIVIDGNEIRANPGETILRAAEEAGIYIPRLCHHQDLSPHGSCRICTVLVNGRPQTACTTPVSPGMIVVSSSQKILEIRRNLIAMLFVEGNHFCMFCEKSGHCELQALAYRFGIRAPQYPYLFPERGVDASHSDVFLDHNRCILCARCVRASRELDGRHELGFVGRGPGKRLTANTRGGELAGTDIEVGDRATGICPVGALLPRRVGFVVPIGDRPYDHGPIGADIEAQEADSRVGDEQK